MSEKHPYKRKQHFVKKGYQFKFILKFCIIVLAGSAISTGLLLLFSQGTLTSSFENSRLVVRSTVSSILPALIYTNIITIVLISLGTIFTVLLISHKIAGPLFRFEKELKELAEGNLAKRINLRKGDQITDIARSLNGMTASLHNKVLTLHAQVERIIEAASKQNAPEGLIEELNSLRQNIDR